jgi:hypothetical protein
LQQVMDFDVSEFDWGIVIMLLLEESVSTVAV